MSEGLSGKEGPEGVHPLASTTKKRKLASWSTEGWFGEGETLKEFIRRR
ncbi:MAG: hypothetical protein P0120_11475 [Nitrospira sp.]|nr:hypothetical protein [Nitrospira sp.]